MWFAFSWLVGTLIGSVLGMGLVVLTGSALGCILWVNKKPAQLVVAVVLVTIIGGIASSEDVFEPYPCDVGDGQVRGIVESSEEYGGGVRYELSFGSWTCGTYLVYGPSYPRFFKGARVLVEGGSKVGIEEIRKDNSGYADYLERNGVVAVWRWGEVTGENVQIVRTALLRQHIEEKIEKVFPAPDGALIKAMLLGIKGDLSVEIKDIFEKAGVSHIIAISGLHISLLAGVWYAILSYFPLKALWRVVITVTGVWGYVGFIGIPDSAQRAAWFITALLVAWQGRRLTNMPSAVILALLIMTMARPRVWLEPGFQLSFAAVIGIFIVLFLTRRERKIRAGTVLGGLLAMVAVSLGAGAVTWPLVVINFGGVSLLGVVANVLVVPLVSLVLPISLFAVFVSYFSLLFAKAVALFVHFLVFLIMSVAGAAGGMPGGFWENAEISIWVAVAYYIAIGVLAWRLLARQGRSWREIWE